MVRRNLRLWLGTAAFAVLVAALALIAVSRTSENGLDGRWDLILIETPEGSFGAGERQRVDRVQRSWLSWEDGLF